MVDVHNSDIFNYIKDLMPDVKGFDILDAGFGGGKFLDFLLQFGQVSAIDILPYNLETGKKTYNGNKNISFKKADLNFEIPYPDDSFDIVFFAGVIEHLYNPEIAMKEIHRVLRYGGSLLLSTQNSSSMKERTLNLLGKPSSETQSKSIENRHLFFFSHSMLQKLMKRSLFKIDKDFGVLQIPKTDKMYKIPIFKSILSDTLFYRAIKTDGHRRRFE